MNELPALTNVSFSDEADYSDSVPSLKEIALMHIRKISGLCCEEFTKGYWESKPLKAGGAVMMSKVYHHDSREAYNNAVDFLADLCGPYADKEFQDYVKETDDEIELIKQQDLSKDDFIDSKLELKRKIFKQLIVMFERTNFFDTQRGVTEG